MTALEVLEDNLAPEPQKMIGIGFNDRDQAEETDTHLPAESLCFAMFASAVTGPFDPIVKPASTTMLDYEAELAVVIGRRGRQIAPSSTCRGTRPS